MGRIPLSSIVFYNELLQRRDNPNAVKYAGLLQPIASDVDSFLSYIKAAFPSYPDHGINHSFRILNYLSSIISPEMVKTMSDTELFCLIMAALFHDTGMALFESDDLDTLRNKHHEFSTAVLGKYFKEKLQILQSGDRLKAAIAFTCKAHGLDIQELYNSPEYEKRDKIESDMVRYSLLSSLLRIGDLMDLEEGRVNEFVLSSFHSSFSNISLDHNIRHLCVQNYFYSTSEITVEVLAENISQFRIWSTWFEYIKNEILYINSYLQKYGVCFPMPKTSISKPPNANFDVEELRFEIDDTGGIWKILSQSIYTDELDFIRELIQNAIDATLLKLYLNSNITISNISPRSWNAEKFCEDVFIGYSQKRKELVVIDSGVGMSNLDLKRFLFKVTGSGYSDLGKRDFRFPSIAKFGIGFVSCLINADNIEIFTKKEGEELAHQVSLTANNNMAILQDLDILDFSGTVIRLKIKYDFSFDRISSFLTKTFVYPSVGIFCVDIDNLEKLSKVIDPDKEFSMVLSTPFHLRQFFNYIESRRKVFDEPLSISGAYLKNIANKSSELKDWINSNVEFHMNHSDAQKFSEFQSKVQEMIVFISSCVTIAPKFPLTIANISEKILFNNSELYIDKLNQYIQQLDILIKDNDKKRQPYSLNYSKSRCLNVTWGFNWKYCIVSLNHDLEVCNIIYTNEPIDLSEKTGIIILNHEINDPNGGYEYASINGFLFAKGEVCTSISKLTGHSERQMSREKYKKEYIIGSFDDDFRFSDVYEQAEETYWEELTDPKFCMDPIVFDDEFSAILCRNNAIVFLSNISKSELIDLGDSLDDNLINSIERGQINLFKHIDRSIILQDEYSEKMMDLDIIDAHDSFVFCQDGIRFKKELMELFPTGIFKIICNLTAHSRLTLNVTRHNFSENRNELDPWIQKTARAIQTSIFENVTQLISDMSLDINVNNLVSTKETSDYLSKTLKEQFRIICNRSREQRL